MNGQEWPQEEFQHYLRSIALSNRISATKWVCLVIPPSECIQGAAKVFALLSLMYFFDGIAAGANRYQPYPGNRRDVTSLHAWLQVTKTSILFGMVEILEPQFNVFFTTGTITIGSGEYNSIHFQAQVLKQLLSQTSSLRSSVCLVPTLCGWWSSTLPGVDIASILLHIMNRWREKPVH